MSKCLKCDIATIIQKYLQANLFNISKGFITFWPLYRHPRVTVVCSKLTMVCFVLIPSITSVALPQEFQIT